MRHGYRKEVNKWWTGLRMLWQTLAFLSLAACAGTLEKEPCNQDSKAIRECQLESGNLSVEIEEILKKVVKPGVFAGKERGGGRELKLKYEMYVQAGHNPHAQPEDNPGAVVFVSGRAESYVKYHELIYDLYHRGYSVFIYDHRGQGLSDPILEGPGDERKGYVENFDDYVEDLNTFIEGIVRPTRPKKMFLLAHSMGGAVASLWAERHPKGADALVLTSPMHQPTLPGGRLLYQFVCNYYVARNAESKPTDYAGDGPVDLRDADFADPKKNDFTHSPIRFKRFLAVLRDNPRAQLTGPTWKWVSAACSGAREAVANASKIAMPILLLQAGSDTVVRPHAQVSFCENAGRCEGGAVVVIEDAKHELFLESDMYRAETLDRIFEFLNKYDKY